MMGLLDLIRGTSISANNRPATAIVATDASNSLQTVAKIAVAQASAPEIHSRDLLPAGAVTQECDLNPDRYCWPHSVAMNSGEIDLFLVRLEAFVARGLNEPKAEELADRLVRRDRESDDRRTCFECRHQKGFNHLRCDNWKVARICSTEEGALRNKEDSMILQRCDGFSAVFEASRGYVTPPTTPPPPTNKLPTMDKLRREGTVATRKRKFLMGVLTCPTPNPDPSV